MGVPMKAGSQAKHGLGAFQPNQAQYFFWIARSTAQCFTTLLGTREPLTSGPSR